MSDYQKVYHWLVVLTILKNMTSSMGMMTSHVWKIKAMFQTTNQKFIARNVGFSRDMATFVGKKKKWNWTKPEVRQVRPVETFL